MTWVLITGATSGIGRDAALSFAGAGLRVIATGRDAGKLAQLDVDARAMGRSLSCVRLDVSDAASVASAAREVDVLTAGYGVDVLINNAGYGELSPVETLSLERARAMFETNVVGLARVTRAFLPAMRARRGGRVVNVSSVMGRLTIAANGTYAAAKHAVEALSDALRREVAPFGVDVVVVEPGAVDTGFTDIAFGGLEGVREHEIYGALADRVSRVRSLYRRTSARPEAITRVLHDAVTASRPRARYAAPLVAAAQIWAAHLAPRPLYEGAVRAAMGLRPRRSRPVESNAARPKLALVTGAASDVGARSALRLAKAGYSVLATDRDDAALVRLARDAKEARLAIETHAMNAADEASCARIASLIERRSEGSGLDALVYCATHGELGPIELATDEAWRAQLEADVYGLIAVTRTFAPALRRARNARFVVASSIAGVITFPFAGVCGAGKRAIEALTDALRLELGAFGVGVSAVQAFVRHDLDARIKQAVERHRLDVGPYAPVAANADAILARLAVAAGEPEDVARAIQRAVTSARPRARYPVPFGAKLAAAVHPWVPETVEDRAFARVFELDRLSVAS